MKRRYAQKQRRATTLRTPYPDTLLDCLVIHYEKIKARGATWAAGDAGIHSNYCKNAGDVFLSRFSEETQIAIKGKVVTIKAMQGAVYEKAKRALLNLSREEREQLLGLLEEKQK